MAKTSPNFVRTFFTDRPVAYHPILAKVCGSVTAALFLSQLAYWSDKGASSDGWIWKTQNEMTDETGLTRCEQETARRILRELGILSEARRGVPARMWYHIEWDVLTNLIDEYEQSSLRESDNLDCDIPANKTAENPPTIQRVSKSTSKKTSSIAPPAKSQNEISENPDASGFGALIADIQTRVTNLSPKMAEQVGELWDEYPDIDAHIHAMQQTDKYASGFNLRYYEQCLSSWWAKHRKGMNHGNQSPNVESAASFGGQTANGAGRSAGGINGTLPTESLARTAAPQILSGVRGDA